MRHPIFPAPGARLLRIAAFLLLLPGPLLLSAPGAWAQVEVRNDETLASHRPEAWAMKYMAASTLMTSFGETSAPAPWRWRAALEAGHIPKLSEAQQRVGFNGTKQEDLNKSPAFGRLRVALGLPGDFVAELGYTPPLEIRGAKPLDLFAFAIGRRVFEGDGFALSMRVFGQHGRALGDITCPARLAGVADPERNPYGCRAPSRDRIALDYYGLDATAAWERERWRVHANAGALRADLAVQVDALTFDVRDRSRLSAPGYMPFLAAGASLDLDARWNLGAELLYVPLRVQRGSGAPVTNDALASLRLRLLYRFD